MSDEPIIPKIQPTTGPIPGPTDNSAFNLVRNYLTLTRGQPGVVLTTVAGGALPPPVVCLCVHSTASGTTWVNPKCPAHGQPPITVTVAPPTEGGWIAGPDDTIVRVPGVRWDVGRILELLAEFDVSDADVLKHRLDDHRRWALEKLSAEAAHQAPAEPEVTCPGCGATLIVASVLCPAAGVDAPTTTHAARLLPRPPRVAQCGWDAAGIAERKSSLDRRVFSEREDAERFAKEVLGTWDRVHELKCWPEFFEDLMAGTKTFEIRVNDRDFRLGDVLALREWNPQGGCRGDYTGRELRKIVTHVTTASDLHPAVILPKNVVILSLR